jgi:hypothetical protein
VSVSELFHRSMIARLAAPLALAAALGAGLACATKFPFQPSMASPAATGRVEAHLDDNGNSWVELRLEHLALTRTLTPPRATYVLWAESQFGRQVLLGQIQVQADRSAQWKGTVPFDKFRILVTAEDIAWPERPREPYVIQTDYFEPDSGLF